MQEKMIFDTYEHIGIYVVDRKSMLVYYENPIAQRYTGRRRIGEPCYKVHGNDAMCSSCPIRKKDHIALINRSDYNMIFAVRCEEVIWDGQEAYLISVVKQGDSSTLTEEEKSMNRMSRALQKSVNVYTEIDADTMQYRQMNLRDFEGFDANAEGSYAIAFEQMCAQRIHPDDVAEFRRVMAPEVLRKISYESEGVPEVSVQYRMKNITPERIMENRVIFLRDELPHYIVCLSKEVTEEYRLRKQADALESVLSNVSCGVAVYNMDANERLTVEYANEGLARLAECSKNVLMQLFAEDAMFGIHQAYRATFSGAFKKIAAGQKRADSTLYATTHKGHHLWLHVNLTASRKEDGVLQIYGTYVDATSDIKIQKEFQERYEVERRRSQDDKTVLAYAVFDLQHDRTIEMERRSPFNKIESQFSLDGFCGDICQSIATEDEKERFSGIMNTHALLEKHEKGIDEQSMEYRRRLPSGKIIWVKSSFHVISDPRKNSTLLFYYCNDINIRKRLELMTAYMVDEDYDMMGSVNWADDSAIMLYGKNSSRSVAGQAGLQKQENYSESLEWFINNAVVPEERQFYHKKAFVKQLKEELAKKDSYEFTLHVWDADKNIRTKKIRYSRNGTDAESCFFSQLDITDTVAEEEAKQKRLQQALDSAKQANEAKTIFLSRMSHDMRTPMNGVLGLAALMRDETSLEAIAADIDQLEMSGKYLLQLINDTLDVSKIESGKMELRLNPIDSEKVFANIFSNASMLAKEKDVQLSVTTPEIKHGDWITVLADASRLEQVIMNVLSNAIKFTPPGGQVQVVMESLSANDKEVVDRYTIRDTGIGMSAEFLTHIYEPFAQEGRANTDRESGTGLGMSIVKQLVELMNGSIDIKSEVGKGTVVTLTMHYPVCIQQVNTPSTVQVDVSVLQNKRVLLCEDHPLNAQIAERLLAKKGVTVERVENGRLGVERFAGAEPGYFDLILMDIRMPEMNGIDATKAIRALDRPDAKTIPIIAMTANAFEDDVKECAEAGMNAHIAKPIDPATMYETIARSL